MRPGYLAPVFASDHGILVSPYQVHSEYISGATVIDHADYEALAADGTIWSMDSALTAKPDHWLWMDLAGKIHYDPKWKAEKAFKEVRQRHEDRAGAALRAGDATAAMAAAEIAYAAGATVEAHALLALCHERLGEDDLARHMRQSALQLGLNVSTFDTLLQAFRENFQPVRQQAARNVPRRRPASPEFISFAGCSRSVA